jgi:hypothetical protein
MSYSISIGDYDLDPNNIIFLQEYFYKKADNSKYRRIALIPTVALDCLLEAAKRPLSFIQRIVLVAINLIGIPLALGGFISDKQFLIKKISDNEMECQISRFDKYTFKAVLINLEAALNELLMTPICLLFSPIKFIHQLAFVIFIPTDINSISNLYSRKSNLAKSVDSKIA